MLNAHRATNPSLASEEVTWTTQKDVSPGLFRSWESGKQTTNKNKTRTYIQKRMQQKHHNQILENFFGQCLILIAFGCLSHPEFHALAGVARSTPPFFSDLHLQTAKAECNRYRDMTFLEYFWINAGLHHPLWHIVFLAKNHKNALVKQGHLLCPNWHLICGEVGMGFQGRRSAFGIRATCWWICKIFTVDKRLSL